MEGRNRAKGGMPVLTCQRCGVEVVSLIILEDDDGSKLYVCKECAKRILSEGEENHAGRDGKPAGAA